jgi:hypothetical protein
MAIEAWSGSTPDHPHVVSESEENWIAARGARKEPSEGLKEGIEEGGGIEDSA